MENRAKEYLAKLGTSGYGLKDGQWQLYPVNLGRGLECTVFEQPTQETLDTARAELLTWLDGLTQSVADMNVYQQYLDSKELIRKQ